MARTKGAKNRPKNSVKIVRFKSSIYRLNISYLTGYGTFPILGKDTLREVNRCPALDSLKSQVLQSLLLNQRSRGLRHYSIAWQTHQSTGEPHLDMLLVYDRNILKSPSSFNYLLELCPQRATETTPGVFITPYSKTKINKSILDYGFKEDPTVLSSFSQDITLILETYIFQKDPYRYLQNQMRKDPLHFNLQQYCQKHNLYDKISGWSSIKNKLKDSQHAAANLLLKNKPGFKYIDRSLIQSRLNPSQLKLYDSWSGYQTIVNHLNQMILYKGRRQMKTLNLLITGLPSVGKTSLFSNPNHGSDKVCVQDFCSVFPMGMAHWFPKYQSGVYHMILWNEAKLTSYPYDTVLKLLEGSYMDLPNKGGVSRKIDNPLIIMTSNLTLQQMIQQKFGYSKFYLDMARKNLAVRVQNVVVPPGYDLFLLQRLLVSSF